jgi:N-acyl homoserine lactone hydrolase
MVRAAADRVRVARIDLGTFVRPGAETADNRPRVEPVYGYVILSDVATVLFDTGIGQDPEVDDWYRPRAIPLRDALAAAGLALADIDVVVNSHLHFDHIGGNPELPGVPVFCQRAELEAARGENYTLPGLVDFPGATYELLDGEHTVAPGVHVVPTPGHVEGHQSVVVEASDGTLVVAGQAHDTASEWSADVLAEQAAALGHAPPLPSASPWMRRLLAFDPRRVVFAHDAAVWMGSPVAWGTRPE